MLFDDVQNRSGDRVAHCVRCLSVTHHLTFGGKATNTSVDIKPNIAKSSYLLPSSSVGDCESTLQFFLFSWSKAQVNTLEVDMILSQHPSDPHNPGWIGKKFIGYWQPLERGEQDPSKPLPYPQNFVDMEWDPQEREMVIDHLLLGRKFVGWLGSTWCCLGCEGSNGAQCHTFDGSWVWPEGLVHYVQEHHVRVPQEFVDHIKSLPPSFVEELRLHRNAVQSLLSNYNLGKGSPAANFHQEKIEEFWQAMDAETARHSAALISLGYPHRVT